MPALALLALVGLVLLAKRGAPTPPPTPGGADTGALGWVGYGRFTASDIPTNALVVLVDTNGATTMVGPVTPMANINVFSGPSLSSTALGTVAFTPAEVVAVNTTYDPSAPTSSGTWSISPNEAPAPSGPSGGAPTFISARPVPVTPGVTYHGVASVSFPASLLVSASAIVSKLASLGFTQINVASSPPDGWPASAGTGDYYVTATYSGAPGATIPVPSQVSAVFTT